jgi:hypothetical protein
MDLGTDDIQGALAGLAAKAGVDFSPNPSPAGGSGLSRMLAANANIVQSQQNWQNLFVAAYSAAPSLSFALGSIRGLEETWESSEVKTASGFGTTAFGNEVHQGFQDVLAAQTRTNPEDWDMATAPGQTGVDARYVGDPSTNPGFNFAELKPVGSSPIAVGNQISNWGLPQGQTSIWLYNRYGIIGQSLGSW